MKNEVAAIRYVQGLDINIPTPNIRCAFEDHGRYYIITDIVSGARLSLIPDDKKPLVIKELVGYLDQLHSIKSKVMDNFLGDVIVPPCIYLPHDQVLTMREATHLNLFYVTTMLVNTTSWSLSRPIKSTPSWTGSSPASGELSKNCWTFQLNLAKG